MRTANNSYLRRNYYLGVANGILYHFSMAFCEPSIILPAFLLKITKSYILIGALSAVGATGWFLPQLFVARYAESSAYKKPYYIATAYIRLTAWLAITLLVAFYLPTISNSSFILLFTLFYVVEVIASGIAGFAFMDIVGKSIPAQRLGSFFGNRMFFGGLLAAAVAGPLIRYILANHPFRQAYTILFSITFVTTLIALALFCLVKEPRGTPIVEARQSFSEFLVKGVSLIKIDSVFRRFLQSRLLLGACAIAAPFYIIYGLKRLEVSQQTIGMCLTIQMVGYVISNKLWGYLSDRKSNRIVLAYAAGLSAIAPILILLSGLLSTYFKLLSGSLILFLYLLVFIILGFVGTGTMIGFTNYLLELSDDVRRPLYIGIANTMFASVGFLPILGGWLVKYITFDGIFALALLFSLAGFILTLKLKELRKAKS